MEETIFSIFQASGDCLPYGYDVIGHTCYLPANHAGCTGDAREERPHRNDSLLFVEA